MSCFSTNVDNFLDFMDFDSFTGFTFACKNDSFELVKLLIDVDPWIAN